MTDEQKATEAEVKEAPRKMLTKIETVWSIIEVWEHGMFITDCNTGDRIWVTKDTLSVIQQKSVPV